MKKRLIALLLALVLIAGMVPSVSAAVEYSGSCGLDLSWTLDPVTGVLHITGTGPMVDYSQNYEPWHKFNDKYTKVIVDYGCTHIGDWAFGFSENLQSVSLPNSVKSIGTCALYSNHKLISCPLPDYLESIDERAFYDCRRMQGLDLPATLTSIGKSAFSNCDAITVANIPGGVKSLPYGVFDDCEKLSTVTFGEGVEHIGESVFRESGVVRVTLPNSCLSVGPTAFRNCDSLISVTMLGCKEIKDWCFAESDNLRKVTLSPNLEKLAMHTFYHCDSLTHFRFPAPVTYIPYGTLSYCPKVKQVVIENPDCEINDYASLGQMGVCTIYGHPGSTAQTYALEKGYGFKPIGTEEMEPSIFTDVNNKEYYGAAVEWAVNNGITTGVSDISFAPNMICSRGQVVTFLWRAAGCPEPTMGASKFTDVDPGAYYYKAMLWAVEEGITTGTSDTTFKPNMNCTRAQVVTFLYRAAGSPAVSGKPDFVDVPAGSYYENGVAWAVENNITLGTGGGKFSPDVNCSRGQIVTFLHRAFG